MVLNKKILSQLLLLLFGILIIFFTYFYSDKSKKTEKKFEKDEKILAREQPENTSTFEDITYDGLDASGNKFIINSEYAEFKNDLPNIINMENILCRFFFKDGAILKITSDKGVYNNITNDIEFEEEVKMYYLENRLFSEKASFINSENYLLVQDDVVGEGPLGNLAADKVNLDLIDKKMKISMYNESKVNIKVNY